MTKERKIFREEKKKATMTPKEKKAAKKSKNDFKDFVVLEKTR